MKREKILDEIQIQIDEAKAKFRSCKSEYEAIELKRALNVKTEAYDFNLWLEKFITKGIL